ncbi:hypothetical protein SNE25_14170 [Mucilaginibacter sabulilitoris]|uniref:Uncharacterized protein n=1 Tax=Mucilaginibacter sabulilitoris TaxID=1173583 RepID=A0ABZ0TV82_9SPHI|nr:hypothetical protein [Mucilaginibacter sabulilitoris]WPU96666.1 hypothetical protein SNE25_14170 [Mucilaginibacter sabulilitoris]
MKPVYILVAGLFALSASLLIGFYFPAISDTAKGFLMGMSIGILVVGLIKLPHARSSAEKTV